MRKGSAPGAAHADTHHGSHVSSSLNVKVSEPPAAALVTYEMLSTAYGTLATTGKLLLSNVPAAGSVANMTCIGVE